MPQMNMVEALNLALHQAMDADDRVIVLGEDVAQTGGVFRVTPFICADVWNPALVGLPIAPDYAHLTQFIKDVYLDSQVTIGLLSNVTASMVQLEGERSRPPRNAEEAQRGEILTAAQTAAGR